MTAMKRLLDEPGNELDRTLLESGLHEPPPEKVAERTLAALGLGSMAVGGAMVGAATTAAGGAATTGTVAATTVKATGIFALSMAKLAGGAAILGIGVGGFLLLRQPDDKAHPRETPAVVAGDAPSESGEASEAHQAEDLPAPLAEQTAPTATERDPDLALTPAPPGDARDPASATKKPKTSTTSTSNADSSSVGTSLGAENALVSQARKAELAGDREACLARIAAYKSRFPNGQLKQTVDAIKCQGQPKK